MAPQAMLQQAHLRFGQGVVGRFLVRGQGDFFSKCGRHGAAVAGHMAHLAGEQTHLGQKLQRQGAGKGRREEKLGRESWRTTCGASVGHNLSVLSPASSETPAVVSPPAVTPFAQVRP